ncbi:hypothetical protein M3699_26535 [Peribacillus simplex]|uniref:hypothetical protein n=1 Tax=Peribacillus simplex TaxID=1478 RepID=UPI00203A5000|nr:hypothetical protein [Peribacillus simplex]MCM3677250.1 hypothetical protein [Peribacillus simplex]
MNHLYPYHMSYYQPQHVSQFPQYPQSEIWARNCRERLARCRAELERCNRALDQLAGLLREGFELLQAYRAALVIIKERRPEAAEDVQGDIHAIDALLSKPFQAMHTQHFEGPFIGSCEQQLLQCQQNFNFCQQSVTTIREQFLNPMVYRLRSAQVITKLFEEEIPKPDADKLKRRAVEVAKRLQKILNLLNI